MLTLFAAVGDNDNGVKEASEFGDDGSMLVVNSHLVEIVWGFVRTDAVVSELDEEKSDFADGARNCETSSPSSGKLT